MGGGCGKGYIGSGVRYGYGASGIGAGKVVDVKSSEAEQVDQNEEDMVVSERTSVVGA